MTTRLEYCREHYEQKIMCRIKSEKRKELKEKITTFEKAFEYFKAHDPTEKKIYISWMMKIYTDEKILLEDLPKIKDILSIYNRHKRNLTLEKRNIMNIKNITELWNLTERWKNEEEIKKGKLKEIDLQSLTLKNTKEVKVVVPLTNESAKILSRGTRWCTASKEGNIFDEYFEAAPLIIFDFKNGEKWQIFVTSNEFQFMNEKDEPITSHMTKDKLELIWKFLMYEINENKYMGLGIIDLSYKMIEYGLTKKILNLKDITKKKKTKEICEIAVKIDPWSIINVPIKQITQELCNQSLLNMTLENANFEEEHLMYWSTKEEKNKKTCERFEIFFDKIPEKYKTKEILMKTLHLRKNAQLTEIDVNNRSEKVYSEYLRHDLRNMKYIEKKEISEKMAINILEIALEKKRTQEELEALSGKLNEFITREFLEKAVQKNPTISVVANKYVTIDRNTYEEAVRRRCYLLEYVPHESKSEKMCIEAVVKDEELMRFIPKEMRKRQFHEKLLNSINETTYEKLKRLMELIPEKHWTEPACRKLINQLAKKRSKEYTIYKTPIDIIQKIPKEILSEKLILQIIKLDELYYFERLPENWKTNKKITIEAVKTKLLKSRTPDMRNEIKAFDVKKFDEIIWKEIVRSIPILIELMPLKYIDKEFAVEMAGTMNQKQRDRLPEKLKTTDFWINVAAFSTGSFKNIPNKNMDEINYEEILKIIKTNGISIFSIPTEKLTKNELKCLMYESIQYDEDNMHRIKMNSERGNYEETIKKEIDDIIRDTTYYANMKKILKILSYDNATKIEKYEEITEIEWGRDKLKNLIETTDANVNLNEFEEKIIKEILVEKEKISRKILTLKRNKNQDDERHDERSLP